MIGTIQVSIPFIAGLLFFRDEFEPHIATLYMGFNPLHCGAFVFSWGR